jgi:hypothetical protein
MKTFIISLACLSVLGVVGSSVAAPPHPHGKANILHCGCAVDEVGNLAMAYIDVNVSSKARGHTKHGNGTIDSCFDGDDTMIDFKRTADDCQIVGTSTQLGNLGSCVVSETETKRAGDICGEPAPES